MKAKFLFCTELYPFFDNYYRQIYGDNKYAVLLALDDSLKNKNRHPICTNDLVICRLIDKPTKEIYNICDRLKVEDVGEVISVCRDIKL